MVRSRSHRDMALEAISRSRFFAFFARDPANRICSPCSACSAYMGQGRGKCSGYRRSTITNLKEVIRGVMGGRHCSPPLAGKSATSATTATQCTNESARGPGEVSRWRAAGGLRMPMRHVKKLSKSQTENVIFRYRGKDNGQNHRS